jgi:hypothetical protein
MYEFFSLSRAERTARAYTPMQHGRVRAFLDAAERRSSAARRILSPIASAALLREAITCCLHAAEVARDGAIDDDALRARDLAKAMPELPPDPARPLAVPADDARVRAALAAHDPLYFDRLSPEDAARTHAALQRASSMLRACAEPRSVANIRGTRWGRALAVVFVVAYAAVSAVRFAVSPTNVALHKPVIPSSMLLTPSHGQTIVDGEIGWSYGIQTKVEDSPNVVVDLIDTYRIDRVQVHNRLDGWFDECLPLVVELSTDGRNFHEIGRRERHFDADPPWVVEAHGEAGRYVRVRVARRGYLALSEVEVFGRKI